MSKTRSRDGMIEALILAPGAGKPAMGVYSRLFAAGFGAMLATGFLMMLMASLVASRDEPLAREPRYKLADIRRLVPEPTEVSKRPKPQRLPEPVLSAPELPDRAVHLERMLPMSGKAQLPPPAAPVNIGLAGGDFVRDTDFIPIFVAQPAYPARALARGREGYAVVEVIITATGSVRDIRLLEEKPAHYGFAKAALKAAAKLRYKPRVVDGEAIEVSGVRYKYSFRLE